MSQQLGLQTVQQVGQLTRNELQNTVISLVKNWYQKGNSRGAVGFMDYMLGKLNANLVGSAVNRPKQKECWK